MRVSEHNDFAAALVDPDAPLPTNLAGNSKAALDGRFAVYRNNVVAGLIGTLKMRFPASCKIVGEDFFGAMAKAFVEKYLPRSPVMLSYGEEFPHFARTFPPAQSVAYLADVAALELATSRAYHAADAIPLAPGALLAIPLDNLMDARLGLHPSLSVVRSSHPVVSLWRMNQSGQTPRPIQPWTAEDAIIARPSDEVEVRAALPGEALFLTALSSGLSLDTASRLATSDPLFDVGETIASLFSHGLVVAVLADPKETS